MLANQLAFTIITHLYEENLLLNKHRITVQKCYWIGSTKEPHQLTFCLNLENLLNTSTQNSFLFFYYATIKITGQIQLHKRATINISLTYLRKPIRLKINNTKKPN